MPYSGISLAHKLANTRHRRGTPCPGHLLLKGDYCAASQMAFGQVSTAESAIGRGIAQGERTFPLLLQRKRLKGEQISVLKRSGIMLERGAFERRLHLKPRHHVS